MQVRVTGTEPNRCISGLKKFHIISIGTWTYFPVILNTSQYKKKVPKGRHDRCESPLLTCKSHVHVSKQHIKMDQPFIQIRTTCAFVSARIKITKAINSHTAYVKKNLAQTTAQPKCSDTHLSLHAMGFFFQLSGYQSAPEGHEKPQLEGRNSNFLLSICSLRSIFFSPVCLYILFTWLCENNSKLHSKYIVINTFFMDNKKIFGHFSMTVLMINNFTIYIAAIQHRGCFSAIGLPLSKRHNNADG